ncbi:MAG: undecaprenyl-diphosphate phosphatase [Candidatus Jacksonbacteria bacterium]|nr:undecaprenyl-diphosphate phosphatase [Candidatus Jacksonbacteria bacterium]
MQSLVLGIIQGLTEFLPISSSGHLILIPKFASWPLQPLAFDAVMHLGTLFAAIFYFRSDVLALIRSALAYKNQAHSEDRRVLIAVILGIIPAGIAGALANNLIETRFRTIEIVGANLILWGILLIAADFFATRVERSDANRSLTIKLALMIGCAQALALIPGTSRFGITITAGIFGKLTRTNAARFSFLMSIPLIAGAGVFKLRDIVAGGTGAVETLPILIGLASSALVGWAAIALLMKTLSKRGLAVYGIYRIFLGALILLFL